MHRELNSHIKPVSHLAAAVVSSTQTPTNGVDLQGFNSATFLIGIGTITNANESPNTGWKFHLEESDSQSSGFTAITDSNQVEISSSKSPVTAPDSAGVFLEVDGPDEDATVYSVGVRSQKRYVRLVATAVNTPGDTPLEIIALLGHPHQVPTSH